jgi:hypothetical protein
MAEAFSDHFLNPYPIATRRSAIVISVQVEESMRELRSYVVRIYRQGFRTLCGLVEDTHTGQQRAFRDERELVDLLRDSRDGPATAQKAKSRPTKPARSES